MDERTLASWGRDIYLNEEVLNDINNLAEDNLDYVNKKFEELVQTTIPVQNLIDSVKNLFTYERGNKGFHRWATLKYFLFEYEDYLKIKAHESNEKISLSDFEDTTIEHIIPQKFVEFWSNEVNDFTDGINAEKQELALKVLLNTLGNLTILKDGKNSSLGNKDWITKKSRFRTGSYNEIDISKNNSWTKKEILERGLDMLSFLETKVEGLEFSDDEKNKILCFDDFLIDKFSQ